MGAYAVLGSHHAKSGCKGSAGCPRGLRAACGPGNFRAHAWRMVAPATLPSAARDSMLPATARKGLSEEFAAYTRSCSGASPSSRCGCMGRRKSFVITPFLKLRRMQ
eukprot:195895-Pyramimonas_sp.AAC.1